LHLGTPSQKLELRSVVYEVVRCGGAKALGELVCDWSKLPPRLKIKWEHSLGFYKRLHHDAGVGSSKVSLIEGQETVEEEMKECES
jgi:hypothetical protein